MSDRITTYAAFWPFYLGEHRQKATRLMHFVGTSLAVAFLVGGAVTGRLALFPIAIVQGYAWAWVSHFFIEKNRPATFTYPGWSFISDWRMWALMLTFQLDGELEKHRIDPKPKSAEVPQA